MSTQTELEQQGSHFIQMYGLVETLSEALNEIEYRIEQIIESACRIEAVRELAEEEKAASWLNLLGCLADRRAYRIALEQSKVFDAITSSEGWTIQ